MENLFDELEFKPHGAGMGGTHARIDFENGYGASVITGRMFYTSPRKPYELAVFKDGSLCYDTPITDDVIGYLTEKEVNGYLNQIKQLPSKTKIITYKLRIKLKE